MAILTNEGHLIGMLDRDQRTAKMRYISEHVSEKILCGSYFPQNVCQTVFNPNRTLSHSGVLGRTSPHSSCKTRKNEYFWKSLQRLKHALLVVVYITLITFPHITSAPLERVKKNRMSERERQIPKWVNPCGIPSNNGVTHEPPSEVLTDEATLTHIISQATVALSKAKHFKSEFVQKSFNMDADQLHALWKTSHYDWLPSEDEIPKQLGEQVSTEHLEGLELDKALLDIYGYLQKIAVGLEQISWDEEDKDPESQYTKSFKDAEYNLRTVLCELQNTILEHNLKMRPDIDRSIMSSEFREMDNTSSSIRNWLIFRDYMNILEYTIEVFNHFKSKI